MRALANLNDQYSFFLFLEYQFKEHLQGLDQTTLEQYTSEVFHRNPFGSMIHVRIGKLESFLQANRGVSFGAYLSTSYEIASSFTERSFELLRETNLATVRFPPTRREGPEHYYRRVLIASGYPPPRQEITDTMSFIRLRRNSIVHLGTVPSPAYQTFTVGSGPSLNTYWKKSKVQIDFTNPVVGPPSEKDTLDLIKFLRISTQHFDAHLASIVDVPCLINSVAERVFGDERVRMNLLIREKRAHKLRSLLTRDFGFSGSMGVLEAAVKTVGVR